MWRLISFPCTLSLPVDITLIASGSAFGFVILCFIVISVCIFLYCLNKRDVKRIVTRRTDEAAIDMQTTPTESDATGATSIDVAPNSSSSAHETSFTNSLYPQLSKAEEAKLDTKEPLPSYNESASYPAAHQNPENPYQV